ncbi:hypothetical protein SAMN04489730_1189 [Amycolatopsis australiensis]|uniref:Uncharacterized protein n=2 Tax=Amycolatopsis australiensis TaxID=546364 RepID=A0A1K1PZT9_9PSEU|nr:hypothetical protein SAMN04489730_1189 [Amycolatopsis australiensis]
MRKLRVAKPVRLADVFPVWGEGLAKVRLASLVVILVASLIFGAAMIAAWSTGFATSGTTTAVTSNVASGAWGVFLFTMFAGASAYKLFRVYRPAQSDDDSAVQAA